MGRRGRWWRKTSHSSYLSFGLGIRSQACIPQATSHPRNALTDLEIPTDLDVYLYVINLE